MKSLHHPHVPITIHVHRVCFFFTSTSAPSSRLLIILQDGPDHGWMGCALAIPLAAYDVLETDIDAIARIASQGYTCQCDFFQKNLPATIYEAASAILTLLVNPVSFSGIVIISLFTHLFSTCC